MIQNLPLAQPSDIFHNTGNKSTTHVRYRLNIRPARKRLLDMRGDAVPMDQRRGKDDLPTVQSRVLDALKKALYRPPSYGMGCEGNTGGGHHK